MSEISSSTATPNETAARAASPSDDFARDPVVAILGGTGPEGRGLALRLAAAGYSVIIGSRDAASAQRVADEVGAKLVGLPQSRPPAGMANDRAADEAEVVILCVPYSAHAAVVGALRNALAGKTVVDVVVPLANPLDVAWRPPAGSAAQEAAQILGPRSRVAAAFHNVSAARLARLSEDVGCDVLVCGDDADAKATTMELARRMGLTAVDAGALANAAVVEGLTAVLLGINRRYRAKGAGVKVTHMP